MNLYSNILDSIKRKPSEVALTTVEGQGFTYEMFQEISAQAANALVSLGLNPGDRIAVILEKSPYNLFLYLGCLQAGIIFLPLNLGYTSNELHYFFEDAEPKLVVCDPSRESEIEGLNTKNKYSVLTLDNKGEGSFRKLLDEQDSQFETVTLGADAVAALLYTSGTTGKPKGAMITHGGLLSNALMLNKVWGITDKDVILHCLPLFHVHGLFFACHTALLSGAKLLFLPKFDVKQVIHFLPQATVFMGVPTYYARLLTDQGFTKEVCQPVRLFISGSAPLLESTFLQFKKLTGHAILERYGMTETGINSSNPLDNERKVGTVGIPLPGIQIRIADNQDKLVDKETTGHIQIKGENLFKGYWKSAEKNKESFTKDGYFKTGDMGKFDEEGYLSIVGRTKDLIITGGLNVYPKEIELTINEIDGVVESAVIGIPHPDFGEAVIAVIAKKSDAINLSDKEIIEYVRKSHATFKIPKKVFFISELPKNTMGKVQKNQLRDKYKQAFSVSELA